MPKRIPILAASDIAKAHNCRQVIVVAWDGERTHVVTYGVSKEECGQAAEGGNRVKRALGWPESLCNAEPSRVTTLKAQVRDLSAMVKELESRVESISLSAVMVQSKLVDRIAELQGTIGNALL